MRYIQIAHTIPGRTRLRCPALRSEPDTVARVADALAATSGVHEVTVRPFTGSILIEHDPEVSAADLLELVQRVVSCERVLARDEQPPVDPAVPGLSKIAKLAANAFREIDRDILRVSQGSLDLGTLTTLGFFGAGAIQLAFEREVEMPPWFNLAWWGYRTFMTSEQDEIAALDQDID
jgi:hypothetical protein